MNNSNNGSLKIIPLGGLDEIGKNMTVFEYKDEIIVIDVGSSFPEEDVHGVQIVLPDFSYLIENKHKVKHLFITHGHEDHIGGIKYFLDIFQNVKVYSSKLTNRLIEKKIGETKHMLKNFRAINKNSKIKTKHFEVSFFETNHSIPDSMGIVIKTAYGNIVHTGDIKIDFSPIDGKVTDYQRISEISKEGVLLLLGDSTNAKKPGFSKSEKTIAANIEETLKHIKNKRVIATTFASNLYRIQSIISIAEKFGRKVVPIGRSMEENIKIALETNFIKAQPTTIIPEGEMEKYENSKILILTTGSQGESSSALKRMVEDEHESVKLSESDFVLFSSKIVPGNEKKVSDLKNKLEKKNVEYADSENLHTSGHGHQEELKMILSLFKPKYFMPIHGEYSMQKAHKQLALMTGVKEENVFILENGDVLCYDGVSMKLGNPIELEEKYVDETDEGVVDNNVLKDRERMSKYGVVVAKVADRPNGVLVKIICKGMINNFDKTELEKEIKMKLNKVKLKDGELNFLNITKTIRNIFRNKLNRYPLIILN